MPKVLYQTVHRPDRSPSQRFRHEQYVPFLEANGFSSEYSYLLSPKDDINYYRAGAYLGKAQIAVKSLAKRFRESLVATDADLIHVQRESFMLGSSWFERQMAKKAPLIFDFDDAIWLPNISSTNKLLSWLKGEDKVKDIIKAAAAVTVGNEFLADYARQFNTEVHVLPTTVDINRHKVLKESNSDRVCIGWTGSHSTVPYFQSMKGLYERLKEKYRDQIEFRLIGDPHLTIPSIDLKSQAWSMDSEVEDLNQFDIGIMPLPDNPWTQGKCGFKALQYMACEIPCVLSPVGVNTEIVEDGRNGLLASDEDEWFEKLSLLIESPVLRKQLGKAGRQTVTDRYSMQAHQQTWLEIFKRFAKSKN